METATALQKETKSLPAQNGIPSVLQGGVLNRVEQFRDKAEALSKPASEWTITDEDPL